MPSRADLAKIHIAKKELGLSDEEYRDILKWRFQVTTAAKLTPRQAFVLLNDFRRRGWKPKPARKANASRPMAQDAASRKIRALWLTLKDMGALRSSSETSLAAYVKRMTGVDALQWLDGKQEQVVIESLKKWVAREKAKTIKTGEGKR